MPQLAQVFEHGTLAVGEQGLTSKHFEALVRYNDRHGCTLFKVGHRRLHFGSYVGVLQVGALTIEILPKAEKAAADKGKWQRALLQMLRQSGLLDVEAAAEADLRLRRTSLIDLYLEFFVSEVERLCHAGLLKKYRVCEANLHKLKGRILFRQQISRNLLHRERMFTAHQVYDADNPFNRILKRALGIVENVAQRQSVVGRASAGGFAFEGVSDARVTADTFYRLQMDRTTERYRKAIQLARFIILNYSPDLRGGSEHVIAILFDMNRLFEHFILVQLLRAQVQRQQQDLIIKRQPPQRFWASRSIRPDVIIDFSRPVSRRLILDTKWKIPHKDQPADEDLKQMYVYNLQFGAQSSLLVYPRADIDQTEVHNRYAPSLSLPTGHRHTCGTHFIELFDKRQQLRRDIGQRLLDRVLTAIPLA
jgi:5-methylcytosine-specific restriction enzyme subunit McrC